MRKVCLVFLINDNFDCLTSFEQAFKEAGFDVEAIRLPNVWISELNRKYVSQLKALFREKKLQGYSVVFSPQSTELFLSEADFTIVYSAYRTWFNPAKMRVIPHLWTPVRSPEVVEHLKWTEKPRLRVSFMGRFYTSSRLANLMMSFPKQVQQWILQGEYLRYPKFIAMMNEVGVSVTAISTFARIETINVLQASEKKYQSIEFDIVEKRGFSGSEQELNEYQTHIEKSTYVVCPRGIENYSFRIYEALSRGRIPVIIDTDIVLPKEIDWERVAIRVPYHSLGQICDVVLHDYECRSGHAFILRQEEAFAMMRELRSMRWIRDLANNFASIELSRA